MRPVALAVLVLLLAASSAQAGWRINRSVAIAQVVWHPTCGQLRLAYSEPVDGAESAGAWAWKGNCAIGVPVGTHYEFEELCTLVLHEAGHVAGMEHSANPRSVMYPVRIFTEGRMEAHGRITKVWGGVDRRCLDRGRPYLEAHGLL